MAALDAGAHHVTAVERWLYLSLTCKETLKLNGFDEDRFKVIYKRPTDLKLQTDVPILCNLLVCDILDEGRLETMACCSMQCRRLLVPHADLKQTHSWQAIIVAKSAAVCPSG